MSVSIEIHSDPKDTHPLLCKETPPHYGGIRHVTPIETFQWNLPSIQGIQLCVYKITHTQHKPFLSFLLEKNRNTEEFELPTLPLFSAGSITSAVKYALVNLSSKFKLSNYSAFEQSVQVIGATEIGDWVTIFIDVTGMKGNDGRYFDLQIPQAANVRMIFGLLDEIVNTRRIFDVPVAEETTDFFETHAAEYGTLYHAGAGGDSDTPIEHPVAAYISKDNETKLQFTSIFGETAASSTDVQSIVGPYFYFTTYGFAQKYKSQCPSQSLIGAFCPEGVVRFALFLGKTWHTDYDSLLTATAISRIDDPVDVTAWTEEYDSVQISDFNHEAGYVKYVVKTYDQQCPIHWTR